MIATKKIVAAILAVGYAAQNGGGVKPSNYVELYEEFSSELTKPKVGPAANDLKPSGDSRLVRS